MYSRDYVNISHQKYIKNESFPNQNERKQKKLALFNIFLPHFDKKGKKKDINM